MGIIEFSQLQHKFASTNPVLIENQQINNQNYQTVIFNNDLVKSKSIEFKGVRFQCPIIFQALNLEGGIHFSNCIFTTDIIFENVKLGNNLGETYNIIGHHPSLTFYNCTFSYNKLVFNKNNEFKGSCFISSAISLKGVTISKSLFWEFNLVSCKLDEYFTISSSTLNHLKIVDSTIDCRLGLWGNIFDTIFFQNTQFLKEILVSDNKIKSNLSFDGGVFEGNVIINPIDKELKPIQLYISNGIYHKDFKINYAQIIENKLINTGFDSVFIEGNLFHSGLFINGSVDNHSYSNDLHFLSIKPNNKFEGFLEVSCFRNMTLLMQGENLKGNLAFKNILLNSLSIHNFYNYSNLQFIHCNPYLERDSGDQSEILDSNSEKDFNNELEISDSYFEKTSFTNCDLSLFKSYSISNSNLSYIKSTGTKWFNYEDLVYPQLRKLPKSLRAA